MNAVLRRREWATMGEAERKLLTERSLAGVLSQSLRTEIMSLLEDVRVRGDDAVCDATRRFDGVSLRPEQLRIGTDEIMAARVGDDVHAALVDAIDHVRRFNEAVRARLTDWSMEIAPGAHVGEKLTPITSVGLFVPGGKASYPSVAYQLGVPAVVAGVPRIAVLVPPLPDGSGRVDPAVLVVCRLLGIHEVYRANGPAGIAALGFGTRTIAAVRKIVGPGSPAVTAAQVEMQRHGVATMMVLGPTESMMIADHSTDPRRAALDLLIEAEHGEDSTVVLVAVERNIVDAIDTELDQLLANMPTTRAAAARAALGVNGGAVLVATLAEACDVVNAFAPEHLQLAIERPHADDLVARINNAGEILVGQDTPFSAANFVLGCPASLPTSGFAAVSSGITVAAFMKTTAIASASEAALRRMSATITALADHEGFPAHGNALRQRFE
ncbi:MAG: histidinol dehydrogenase [Ilumatobacteraceae bacterium]|nr:histidinol dehydrogenase [Ilumatobacteraceae bacterium]